MIRLIIDTLTGRRRCRNCHWYVQCRCRRQFSTPPTHPDATCRNHSWTWRWW